MGPRGTSAVNTRYRALLLLKEVFVSDFLAETVLNILCEPVAVRITISARALKVISFI